MAATKIAALGKFVRGSLAIRDAVRADAKRLMERLTIDVISDEKKLADWLLEMMTALMAKHVIAGQRKLKPAVAALVRDYVEGMVRIPPELRRQKP